MSHNPHTYGTGRDPARKNSHLTPIVILLLCCVVIHSLTFLYLRWKDRGIKTTPIPTLALEEFSQDIAEGTESLEDGCGLGLQFSELSDSQQAYWSLPEGVFIEQIEKNGPAYEAGLRPGDLLLQVGNEPVDDPRECLEALQKYCGQSLSLIYYREGQEYAIVIDPALTEQDG